MKSDRVYNILYSLKITLIKLYKLVLLTTVIIVTLNTQLWCTHSCVI